MHRRRTGILAGAALGLVLAAVPAVALAHTELVSTSPEAGANLDAAPTEVTLTFDDEIKPDGSEFTVTDADGAEVGQGEIDLTVADRNVLTGDVTITEPGVYTVSWTAVALDGHADSGTFSFGYATDEDIPEPTGEDEPADTAMPAPAPPLATILGLVALCAAILLGVRQRAHC